VNNDGGLDLDRGAYEQLERVSEREGRKRERERERTVDLPATILDLPFSLSLSLSLLLPPLQPLHPAVLSRSCSSISPRSLSPSLFHPLPKWTFPNPDLEVRPPPFTSTG